MRQKDVVRRALIYMKRNYHHKLTLSEVAEHAYVSPWYLSKLLKQYAGRNFADIRSRIRIEYAKKMLKEQETPICVIAEKVGFQAPCHFSRTFKKIVGVSPDEYRKS